MLFRMASTDQPPSPSDSRLLLDFVAGRDCTCPVCRYNVRDLTTAVCPECGCTLRLQVGTPTPRIGSILLLMSPLVAVAGIGLLFAITAVFYGPPPAWGFYVIEIAALVDLVGCFVIHRNRHRYMRRNRKTQALLILLSWVFHVLLLVVSIKFGAP